MGRRGADRKGCVVVDNPSLFTDVSPGRDLFPSNVGHHPGLRRWTWDQDKDGTPLTPHERFWQQWEAHGWQPELWEFGECAGD